MHHPDAPPLEARREGFLVGAAVGAARVAVPPAGRRHAAIALGDGLLEELLAGGVDLRRLAGRWQAWYRDDGYGADPALVEALEHLERFEAPPQALGHTGPAALAAALPAALAAASPRSMVTGAFHTARLVDPDPASGLAAVATVVAAARLLEGSRDLMPDVLALLTANHAPDELTQRFRAIAADPRREPAPPLGTDCRASVVAVWSLWQVQHRPRSVEVLEGLADRTDLNPTAAAVLGALLGARDGLAAWPAPWLDRAGEDGLLRRAVAARLATLTA